MKILMILAATLALAACADTRASNPGRPAVVQAEPSAEVRDAQQRLQALGLYGGQLDNMTRSALRTPPATPVVLSDATDVRAIQNRLRQLNFYNGPADSVWGPSTQLAMENFQRSRGLPVGEVNRPTLTAMGMDAAAFPARHSAATTIREPLQPGVVRGVQRLRAQGHCNGKIDGVWGPNTERGLARFQRSRGLEQPGHLNPTTAQALGLDPSNLSLNAVPPAR